MDRSGLTNRQNGIVVVNKSEHQLPMFTITFRPNNHAMPFMPPPPGVAGMPAMQALYQRLNSLRAAWASGGVPAGGGAYPYRRAPKSSRGRRRR